MSFEIVSRRGQNKSETIEAPAKVVELPSHHTEGSWEDVSYMLTLGQTPQGFLFIGRAVGLRDDGKSFVADWVLPPIWPEGLKWEIEAKKRLDTFLDCECNKFGPCGTHKLYIPQWQNADVQRLNLMSSAKPPKAIECLVRSEQSKTIVAPR